MNVWYKTKVLKGAKVGRTIGFPTINLVPDTFINKLKEGVYAAQVKHKNKIYLGALYFGPRLVKNETHPVLEIYILNFTGEIYEEYIEFMIYDFIRGIKNFKTLTELKKQIEFDVENIKKILLDKL